MPQARTIAILSSLTLTCHSAANAEPVAVIIGVPSPDPAVQGSPVTIRYSLMNAQRAVISGTIAATISIAGCSLPSCVTTLPTATLSPTSLRRIRRQLALPPLLGRKAYTLHISFQASNPAASAHASRNFYVEAPGEQADAFRNGVDVSGPPFPASFCSKTNHGWRFERDVSNRLRAYQPYNQCNGQPQSGWMTLGNARLASAPALALSHGAPGNQPNDRIHLFFRGRDGLLWTWVWDNKPFNIDPMPLGGPITSAPTAIPIRQYANRVELFYRDADNRLVNRTLDIGQSWGSEKILVSGGVDSAPAAFTFRNGLDLVVYRGWNKHLWLITRDRRSSDVTVNNNAAPWSTPADLGGLELRSSPGISAKSGSRVVVEYRGPNDTVWESSWDGKTWWSAPLDTKAYP